MPALFDARAQVRLFRAHLGAHRVAGAARRVDDDVVGDVLRPLGREAEFHRAGWECPSGTPRAVGYFFATISSSCASRVLAAGPEARCTRCRTAPADARAASRSAPPPAEPAAREHLLEHRPDARLGDLAIFVEAAGDQRRRGRRVRIGLARRAESLQQRGVAGVGFACVAGLGERASRRPNPSPAAGFTSLVNGFQSTCGLSTTACGIVCVTIRSITC